MLDAACARYGNQDIHKLRGVKKLSYTEKLIFNECVKELMDAEFNPRDMTGLMGGAPATVEVGDD